MSRRKSSNVTVTSKECKGNFERMVRRFIKKCKKEKIIEQVKDRKYHKKRSDAKRHAKQAAIRRHKRNLLKQRAKEAAREKRN